MIKKRLMLGSDEDSENSENEAKNTVATKFRRKRNDKNVLFKLINRSRFGFFNNSINRKCNDYEINQIPSEMRFCLKDIVPFCYLSNQIYMGLSFCGNFLISYSKRLYCENESFDFNSGGYKYELFFWIFRPHMPLERYFKINLFDDHGVEDIKTLLMTQWKTDPRTIIVHGSSEIDDQHSFASIIRVPKLGCLNCKRLRENESSSDNLFKNFDLCIECNLTIHTKYRFNESTQKFHPKIHLNSPDYLIMCENSLIHTINYRLDMQRTKSVGCNTISQKYLMKANITYDDAKIIEVGRENANVVKNAEPSSSTEMMKPISIVEQILADFSEFETTEVIKNGCEDKNNTLNIDNKIEQPKSNNNYQKTENNGESSSRLIKKTTPYTPSSPEMMEAAAKTYEFSEENEKCEKISIFRKRRLADKKYEFNEENTENIIPFNRTRNKISKRSITTSSSFRRGSPHPSNIFSPCSSPNSFRSPNYYHTYRSSPTYHFLCSPPSRHIVSSASQSEEIHKYFSDIMNRMKDGRIESGNESHDEIFKFSSNNKDSPMFSKKIVHHYVEEDDANSVVTCEEDDCISPGYHLSLPMEVHGACYSKMQIVSKPSLSRLKGHPRVIITQNSFDVETFSIHIANLLCKKNDKKYGILFDLAFEIIHVCPNSQLLLSALCLQFTASEFDKLSKCLNCSNESDCYLHRRLYETTVLFSWKMTTDEIKILDSGQLKQISSQTKLVHSIRGNRQEMLIRKLQRFVKKIFGKDRVSLDSHDHLKILDCNENKSKNSLIDYDHGIEFYRRQPYDSPSSVSSMSSQSDINSSSDSCESCDESLH
ncbi:hypothetical protein PVAND_003567 [Polypedilum vanderplanki]|uniref:DDB1- and CUL4-associated factor 15 WD40 repeat-containing domain-containing protein n=1 Tax=Polypedilum vanderplanki TaxID=319348 RepID=A0A9J6BW86_POLVA|nr:hypothetical protein PVAND_003567 [Polypedilum vanderplanki]